jgi:hypothetical protein
VTRFSFSEKRVALPIFVDRGAKIWYNFSIPHKKSTKEKAMNEEIFIEDMPQSSETDTASSHFENYDRNIVSTVAYLIGVPEEFFREDLLMREVFDELSANEIMQKMGFSERSSFRKNYLAPALEADLIERTIPDKPNSRLQKYRRVKPLQKQTAEKR